MRKNNFNNPKEVLIFNAKMILIAKAGSARYASDVTGCNVQSISLVCTGRTTSSLGFYFRYVPDNIEIEKADYGSLSLREYDQLCGQERVYHSERKIEIIKKRSLNFKKGETVHRKKRKSKELNEGENYGSTNNQEKVSEF